jgi:hypothetical protein
MEVGVFAQHPRHVDARSRYYRVRAVVPIVGKGTLDDPRLAYSFQESDDKRFALVEFVALDPAAFRLLLAETTVTSFLPGRDSQASLEALFRSLKKDFDPDHFGVRMP